MQKDSKESNYNYAICEKRRSKDILRLQLSNYKVQTFQNNKYYELLVDFEGPKDSYYEGGSWKINVTISEAYPYKSPSIGFVNKIFHPNIDEGLNIKISGAVCLDVINQTWSPMFDLFNIFEVFLPQLLLYPNPKDPLNPEAAHLLLQNEKVFKMKAQEYVKKYALLEKTQTNSDEKKHSKGQTEHKTDEIQKQNSNPSELYENAEQIIEEEEKLSSLSDASDLSRTSNISLLEDK